MLKEFSANPKVQVYLVTGCIDVLVELVQGTWNGDYASKFLGDYLGYVICDGYDCYNKLKKRNAAGAGHI